MLDLFNIPTPQTANYQEFYGGSNSTDTTPTRTWIKPRGVSMVRFLLIGGAGGGGNGSSTAGGGGGGSGAIVSWIGPAMFVPDILNVSVGLGGPANTIGKASIIGFRSSNGQNEILTADVGRAGGTSAGGAGGNPMTANQFTASGIFTSIAGQNGSPGSSTGAGSPIGASTTTFIGGGGGGAGASGSAGGGVTPNYGYPNLTNTAAGGTVAGRDGYFITQPILVGCGGAGGTTSTTVGSAGGRGGIGCGGGGAGEDSLTGGGRGGDGAVYIWAW